MTLGKTQKIALMSISGQFIIRTRFGKLKLIKPAKARFLLTHGKLVHVKAKKDLFKINPDTKALESILNSKPVELKMRALVRPKESDPETASLIKILTFDLCAPEE